MAHHPAQIWYYISIQSCGMPACIHLTPLRDAGGQTAKDTDKDSPQSLRDAG